MSKRGTGTFTKNTQITLTRKQKETLASQKKDQNFGAFGASKQRCKFHGFDGFIRVKMCACCGKKVGSICNFAKSSSNFGDQLLEKCLGLLNRQYFHYFADFLNSKYITGIFLIF